MTSKIIQVKCREKLARLDKQGLAATSCLPGTGAIGAPDVLLISNVGRVWMVLIWTSNTLEGELMLTTGSQPSLESRLSAFIAWRKHAEVTAGTPHPAVVILAPALPETAVPRQGWMVEGEVIPILGMRTCGKTDLLGNALLQLPCPQLEAGVIARWRALVVPEVAIDVIHKRRQLVRPEVEMVAPLLLDYQQERCARLDLELDADLESISKDLQVRVVTGVAGCGKTLVLVHRAALLARHFPQARVLLVSHNRPLVADLGRRLKRLGCGGQVHCLTFTQWLHQQAAVAGDAMPSWEVLQWVERERYGGGYASLAKFSESWLVDEMAWMFDQALVSDAYLAAPRKGRGRGITETQRREILLLVQRYRAFLRETQRSDWNEQPLLVWERFGGKSVALPYDHLLIDEAQFFAPVWFHLLQGALRPGGHIFLCADPTQGFLRRRQSWAGLGFTLSKRSHKLERPYRSTRAILQFARDFYQRRLPDDDEPLNLPSPEWMQTLEPGLAPIIQPAGPGQDQLRRLGDEMLRLRESGVPLSAVLVLIAGRDLRTEDIVAELKKKLGPEAVALVKDEQADPSALGVAHLMAATGLERPIVFLLGLDALVAEECNPLLAQEEREEKVRDATRQIYVGLTRAMERLVIYASHPRLLEVFRGVGG
jgi:superfamily I DNA/RNA helicase